MSTYSIFLSCVVLLLFFIHTSLHEHACASFNKQFNLKWTTSTLIISTWLAPYGGEEGHLSSVSLSLSVLPKHFTCVCRYLNFGPLLRQHFPHMETDTASQPVVICYIHQHWAPLSPSFSICASYHHFPEQGVGGGGDLFRLEKRQNHHKGFSFVSAMENLETDQAIFSKQRGVTEQNPADIYDWDIKHVLCTR